MMFLFNRTADFKANPAADWSSCQRLMRCSCEIAPVNSSATASAQGNELVNEMRRGRGCDK